MLICYLAVDLDGTPALDVTRYDATPDGWDECAAYLTERVYTDGAERPMRVGDRSEVKQDGVTVAVVVRA